jgi:hypothetical protein
VPPIAQLTRIEPIHLERLARRGVFATGLLQEASGAPTRRRAPTDLVTELWWEQTRTLHGA